MLCHLDYLAGVRCGVVGIATSELVDNFVRHYYLALQPSFLASIPFQVC